MKRSSAHLSRSSTDNKPMRSQYIKNTENSEALRFRERDGTSSTYIRLYAQGVDSMVRKDHVYQQFGLLKSPQQRSRAPKPVESKTQSTSTLRHSNERKRVTVLSTRPLLSRHSTSDLRQPRSLHSSSRPSLTRTRSNTCPTSTPKHHCSIALSLGKCERTRPSSVNMTPSSPPRQNPPSPSKPQRRQSTIATELLAQRGFTPGGNRLVRKRSGIEGSVTAIPQPQGAFTALASPRVEATVNAPVASRRMSFQNPSTSPRRASTFNLSPKLTSKDPVIRSDVSTAQINAVCVTASPAPVLVPVSRRTSSPFVTSQGVGSFGSSRRPSVSPIRSGKGAPCTLGISEIDPITGQLRPIVTSITRRDSTVDRLVEQITVLKNSLGLSEEDLQWKVESTKGNAYLAADQHLQEAEENYDRLMYEIMQLNQTPCDEASAVLIKRCRELIHQTNIVSELKPKLVTCQNDVTRLKKELMEVKIESQLKMAKEGCEIMESEECDIAQKAVDIAIHQLLETQEHLENGMIKLNDLLVGLGKETDTLDAACQAFTFTSSDIQDVSNTLINVMRCIPECNGDKLVALCEQGIHMAQRLTGSRVQNLKRKEADVAKFLKEIEIWKARRDQSKEFITETAKREQKWKEENAEENTRCLRILRALIPPDIHQLSVDSIVEKAAEKGILYTYDLAQYLKQNKFIQWVITHGADIVRDNFLAVECASYFLNFTTYDITELRGLCRILPDGGFEFDKNGKKNEWKNSFIEHVQLLAKQQRGETIKAGWDPIRQTRAEVCLKPLNEKQVLNVVYRYPTETEITNRLQKLEVQKTRLKQKQETMIKLEEIDIPIAKAEYMAIAEDARSEDCLRQFGKNVLIKLRDEAKASLQALVKTRDNLKSEIEHSQRIWNTMTPSYEQYIEEVAKIRALDNEIRNQRIRGAFDEEFVLPPKARAAFKKLSVEEEAYARKQELSQAIADRDKVLEDTESTIPSAPTAVSVVAQGKETTDSLALDSVEQKVNAVGADSTTHQSATFKRVKSLRVSVEVLRFLQQDFCGPRRTKSNNAMEPLADSNDTSTTPPVPPLRKNRRSSISKPSEDGVLSVPSEARLKVADPSQLPRPKSKALLAILEKEKANHVEQHSVVSPTRPTTDFLAELKKRSALNSNEGSTRLPPTMSFLDELKQRKDDKGGEKVDVEATIQPKSFLDELKQRKLKTSEETETSTPPPAPLEIAQPRVEAPISLPARSVPGNFLDELKARALKKVVV